MTSVLLFMDMEFPQGRGTQVEKSWKLQWMRGEYCEAPSPGTENPGGWGQTGKKPP